jgi:asparagine synthase (glutamine-hydrolysing)
MCGICGIFDKRGAPVDRAVLEAMMSVLRHRGPDGQGTFVEGNVALGNLRLSIIDLEGGSQPVGNEDRRLQVVFNGEIYNFVELRTELESLGHRFTTRSDTEVIVHAYEEWGEDCVTRFNGMFAFALWDSSSREVFLARDHLGIKPLYYVDLGTRVLFASEIKALLQDPDVVREVDVEALAQLFTFRFVPSPRTMFRGILKLPPGHCMTLSARGVKTTRYWTWVPPRPSKASEGERVEEYQALLSDAVRLQLRSDVPLGLFLSSGVDSGVLLALMSEYSSSPVNCFTIGFQGGERTNEITQARELATRFGANHDFMMVTPDDYRNYYDRYMWDLEEPVGNETAAAFYFVSRVTSQHVKVALTGQGADEPWAGYDRYIGAKFSAYYSRLPGALTTGVARVVTSLPGRLERLKRGAIALAEPDMLTRLSKIYSFFSDDMKGQLYSAPLKAGLDDSRCDPRSALRSLQQDVRDRDPLTQMLYIDARASLPDDLLMVGDKMSMANSLETRVPFLDRRLVEFIESLPAELKLNKVTGKYLHKRALEKWLPKQVVWRKKKGFANPIEHWFRHDMRTFVEELLLAGDARVRLFFNQGYIRRMLDLDREGKEQLRRHIYLLVSFELWHRRFLRP